MGEVLSEERASYNSLELKKWVGIFQEGIFQEGGGMGEFDGWEFSEWEFFRGGFS